MIPYIVLYMLGSLLSFLIVFRMYDSEYKIEDEVNLKRVMHEYPEATLVFTIAVLLSWVYALFYFIAWISNYSKTKINTK